MIACAPLTLIAILSVGTGAAQVRDGAAPPSGSASIAGTLLTDSKPASPVRRAAVTVNSADRRLGRTAITDDAGRFVVTGLPAGRYSVNAIKRGWISTAYGAKAPGRPGRSIPLADGERATVTLRISRGGVITGTVLDPAGHPVQAVSLRVLRYAYAFNTGERRLVVAGANSTGPDERGVYRLWGLAPGEYYVAVVGQRGFVSQSHDLHLTTDVDVQEAQRALQLPPGVPLPDVPQRSVGLAPVFYPGVTEAAQATPIAIRAGEERGGIDLTVQYVSTSRVSGTVSGLDGNPQAGVQVYLLSNNSAVPEMGFEGLRPARTGPDGAFAFAGIRPGRYGVAARANAPGAGSGGPMQVVSALTDVEVYGQDVTGVSLQLQEGLTVSGSVRFDGTAVPPPFTSVRVTLFPAEPGGMSISSASPTILPDGRFVITSVSPGRYRLSATAPPGTTTWTMRSSIAGGQDGLDGAVDIRQSIAGAEITLTDRHAELSGRIQDVAPGAAPDYTIVLFSTDRAHWRPPTRRVVVARTAADGTFVFRTVPPGEYMMAAVDDLEQGEWFDPTFLQRLVLASIKVSIAEGEKKVQDIRLGGG